jgi:hypothetical protein
MLPRKPALCAGRKVKICVLYRRRICCACVVWLVMQQHLPHARPLFQLHVPVSRTMVRGQIKVCCLAVMQQHLPHARPLFQLHVPVSRTMVRGQIKVCCLACNAAAPATCKTTVSCFNCTYRNGGARRNHKRKMMKLLKGEWQTAETNLRRVAG